MRRLVVTVALALVALAASSAAFGYIATHATATARFHVSDGTGSVDLSVAKIEGALQPGGSVAVRYRIANNGAWQVKVARVKLDDPAVTDLPDGCPASAFGWTDKALNARIDAGDHLDGSGALTLDAKAPAECAGADPLVHLTTS